MALGTTVLYTLPGTCDADVTGYKVSVDTTISYANVTYSSYAWNYSYPNTTPIATVVSIDLPFDVYTITLPATPSAGFNNTADTTLDSIASTLDAEFTSPVDIQLSNLDAYSSLPIARFNTLLVSTFDIYSGTFNARFRSSLADTLDVYSGVLPSEWNSVLELQANTLIIHSETLQPEFTSPFTIYVDTANTYTDTLTARFHNNLSNTLNAQTEILSPTVEISFNTIPQNVDVQSKLENAEFNYSVSVQTKFSYRYIFTAQYRIPFLYEQSILKQTAFPFKTVEYLEVLKETALPFVYRISKQTALPFNYLSEISKQVSFPFVISDLENISKQSTFPFVYRISKQTSLPFHYHLEISKQSLFPFIISDEIAITKQSEFPFIYRIDVQTKFPFHYHLEVSKQTALPFKILDTVEVAAQFSTSFKYVAAKQTSFLFIYNQEVSKQTAFPFKILDTENIGLQSSFPFVYLLSKQSSFPFRYEVEVSKQTSFPFLISEVTQTSVQTALPFIYRLSKQTTFPFHYTFEVSKQTSFPFIISDEITVALQTSLPFRFSISVRTSFPFIYLFETSKQTSFPFVISNEIKVDKQTALPFVYRFDVQKSFPFQYEIEVSSQFVMSFGYENEISKQFSTSFSILDNIPILVQTAFPFIYSQQGTILITQENYIVHNQRIIRIEDVAISQSWDTWYWSGGVTLLNLSDFHSISQGDAITLYLQGDTYELIVESRHIAKDETNYPKLTLKLASPTLQLSREEFSDTFVGTLSRDATEEIAGSVINWNIIDWFIPSGILSFSNAKKSDAIRKIVGTVKGIIQTTKSGDLRTIYRYPLAVNSWNRTLATTIVSANQELSFDEEYSIQDVYNAVVISEDEEQRNISLEYVADESGMGGVLRVYCQPFVDSSDLTVECTGHPSVIIYNPTVALRSICDEEIEFQDGSASVKYPIYTLDAIVWQHRDLSPIVWNRDKKDISANGKFSIAIADYSTRYWEYPVVHDYLTVVETAQFVVTQKYLREDSITCKRGAGDIYTDEINDPLLTTLPAKLACARNVLDDGEKFVPIQDTFVYLPDVNVGDLVEIYGFMPSYVAQVVSVEHSLTSSKELTTKLDLIKRDV